MFSVLIADGRSPRQRNQFQIRFAAWSRAAGLPRRRRGWADFVQISIASNGAGQARLAGVGPRCRAQSMPLLPSIIGTYWAVRFPRSRYAHAAGQGCHQVSIVENANITFGQAGIQPATLRRDFHSAAKKRRPALRASCGEQKNNTVFAAQAPASKPQDGLRVQGQVAGRSLRFELNVVAWDGSRLGVTEVGFFAMLTHHGYGRQVLPQGQFTHATFLKHALTKAKDLAHKRKKPPTMGRLPYFR